jgi:hypothetical protein
MWKSIATRARWMVLGYEVYEGLVGKWEWMIE